jgi:hypothetical protein
VTPSGITRRITRSPSGRSVSVSQHRGDTPAGRLLLFSTDAPIVREAICTARDGQAKHVGEFRAGTLVVAVWTRGGAVFFGRRRLDGERIGGPTILAGEELDALDRALVDLGEGER